jgi:cytochrome c oxidase subunit 2
MVRWAAAAVVVVVVAVAVTGCGGAADEASGAQAAAGPAERGAELYRTRGCASCHTVDGSRAAGPTWQGLLGSQVELADGTTVTADRAYITRSVRDPDAQQGNGYNGVMPAYDLTDDEIDDLVAYLRTLDDG